ncbi:hypothetical protein M407DRAFT_108293 [Tulasnella calospora MUT 4182]|uniref:DUF3224 domain-containing protein n=1 Tax=Tulasnella calospora MUT 4182 TaxID=1051891 RepID=A0A0C3QJC3_9AGAM|nr:hypothetical protein M407DRAFT_108293 [Tulasnella calospora MUT 4182]
MASSGAITTCKTDGWEEAPISDSVGSLKITRVRTTRTFAGRLTGKGLAEYVMVYREAPPGVTDPHQMTAKYVGIMVFKGTLDGGKEGEAHFTVDGLYDGTATAKLIVDEKTCSGGLKGLKGEAKYGWDAEKKELVIGLDGIRLDK